jgi:Ring finger domain
MQASPGVIVPTFEGSKRSQQQKVDIMNPASLKSGHGEGQDTRGLSSFEINSIITNKYRGTGQGEEPSAEECKICLVEYGRDDEVKMLPCLHKFHSRCASEWLSKKSICPECQLNLRALDFKQFY